MDGSWWTLFGTVFVTVFLAELGDKTQLAAFGMAATADRPWAVFLGSALALTLASALAVGLGRVLAARVDPRWLHYASAVLFLVIGLVLLVQGPDPTPTPDAQSTEASETPH